MRHRALLFGPFVLQTSEQALVRGGERVALQPKTFETMRYLAENAPRVVTREELLAAVWDGIAVSENTVDQAVSKVRRALGDGRGLLETVPGRGWRLAAEVTHDLVGESLGLPEVAPRLFGRDAELAAIARLLGGDGQLITLLGPGGIGKTALARAALDAWGAGGRFVDLSACRTAVDAIAVMAQALGVPARTGREAPGETLARAIAASGVSLWVLDNLERIAEEVAPLVALWAGGAPSTRFLATSRQRLGLRNERILEVGPLELTEAAKLLRARVEELEFAVGQDLSDVQARAVAEAVDRVPLALELAATRLLATEANALVDELAQHLLEPDARTAHPDRQRSIEATLRWSWELLPDWARDAAEQLAIFRAPFDTDLAEAVLALPSEAPPPLQILGALRSRSLLSRERDADGRIRLRLLDAVRTFAGAELASRGADRVVTAHAQAVLARVRPWIGFRPSALPHRVRARMQALVPELQAVLERGLARGDWASAGAAALVLARHHHALGLFEEETRVLAAVVAAAPFDAPLVDRVHLHHAAGLVRTEGVEASLSRLSELSDRLQPALRSLHRLRYLGARQARGDNVAQELFALADSSGDDRWIRAVALQLGVGAGARAEVAGLLDRAQEAVEAAAETDDEILQLASMNSLFEVQRSFGRYDAGEVTLVQGIALAEQIGVPVHEAGMLLNLSDLRALKGDYAGAERDLARAESIAVRIGDWLLDGFVKLRRAVVLVERPGAMPEVRALLGQARERFTAAGRVAYAVGTWTSQAQHELVHGEDEEAARCARRALEILPDDALVSWRAHLVLAKVALARGEAREVGAFVEVGLRALGTGWGHVAAEFLAVHAAACALLGEVDEALRLRALALEAIGDHPGESARWVPLLASLALAGAGDEAAVPSHLAQAAPTTAAVRWVRGVVRRALPRITPPRG